MTPERLKRLRQEARRLLTTWQGLPDDSPVKQKAAAALRDIQCAIDELEELERK